MFFHIHICFNFSARLVFLFVFSLCILEIFLLSRNALSSFTVLLNISNSTLWMVSQKLPKDVFVCCKLCQQAQQSDKNCILYYEPNTWALILAKAWLSRSLMPSSGEIEAFSIFSTDKVYVFFGFSSIEFG